MSTEDSVPAEFLQFSSNDIILQSEGRGGQNRPKNCDNKSCIAPCGAMMCLWIKKGFAGVFDQGTNVSTESLSKQPAFGAVVSPRISGCTDTKTKNRLVVL